jgi:hypothetical protein
MKTYSGDRTIDGIQVLVNGAPLPTGEQHQRYAANGFEWGYEGPEPAQLAFALLADHLADPTRAAALHATFMRTVVANLANTWDLTSADIDIALAG